MPCVPISAENYALSRFRGRFRDGPRYGLSRRGRS